MTISEGVSRWKVSYTWHRDSYSHVNSTQKYIETPSLLKVLRWGKSYEKCFSMNKITRHCMPPQQLTKLEAFSGLRKYAREGSSIRYCSVSWWSKTNYYIRLRSLVQSALECTAEIAFLTKGTSWSLRSVQFKADVDRSHFFLQRSLFLAYLVDGIWHKNKSEDGKNYSVKICCSTAYFMSK